MTTISIATQDDISHCNSIDQNLGFQTNMPVFIHATRESRLLVASMDNTVVGYLRFSWLWDEKLPYIQVLRIHTDYRRQGIGKDLIAALEEELKIKNVTTLLSSTEETNTDSLAFHEAVGFENCGVLSINEDGQPEIFLKKSVQ